MSKIERKRNEIISRATDAANRYRGGQRIAKLYCRWDRETGGFGRWFDMLADAYSYGERLYFAIHPSQSGNRQAAAIWWDRLCGNDSNVLMADPRFILAFVEAVVERVDAGCANSL